MAKKTLPENRFYIYVLFDWRGNPFYVGKGSGKRWEQHEWPAEIKRTKSHKRSVISTTFLLFGELPKIKVAEHLTNKEAYTLEKIWIAAIGREPNGPLLNKTDGGPHPDMTGTKQSAEHIRKKSEALKGRRPSDKCIAAIIANGPKRRKFSPLVEREIVNAYAAGASTSQLGALYGIDGVTARNIVKRNGGTLRPAGNAKLSQDQRLEIVRLYNAGATSYALADQFGIARQSVLLIARTAGCIIRPRGGILGQRHRPHTRFSTPKSRFSDSEKQQIVALYAAGHTSIMLAAQYGVSPNCIIHTLRACGCTIRYHHVYEDGHTYHPHKDAKHLSEAEMQEIAALYAEGSSGSELSARFGVCSHKIIDIARAAGCIIRARGGYPRKGPTK